MVTHPGQLENTIFTHQTVLNIQKWDPFLAMWLWFQKPCQVTGMQIARLLSDWSHDGVHVFYGFKFIRSHWSCLFLGAFWLLPATHLKWNQPILFYQQCVQGVQVGTRNRQHYKLNMNRAALHSFEYERAAFICYGYYYAMR